MADEQPSESHQGPDFYEDFFMQAEVERQKRETYFIEQFWREDILGDSSWAPEFSQLDERSKVEKMYEGFKHAVDELIDSLDIPHLSAQEFDEAGERELLQYLEAVMASEERELDETSQTEIRNRIKDFGLLQASSPEALSIKQEIYVDILRGMMRRVKKSTFDYFPTEAKKHRSASCLMKSALVAAAAQRTGIDCEMASVVGHMVNVVRTADGQFRLFDPNSNTIESLIERDPVKGFSLYIPDPESAEEDQQYTLFIRESAESIVDVVLGNVHHDLSLSEDREKFDALLAKSNQARSDRAFFHYFKEKYPEFFERSRIRDLEDRLCPAYVKFQKTDLWRNEYERVKHREEQDYKKVADGRTRQARERLAEPNENPDFKAYREWVADQLSEYFVKKQTDGNAAHRVTNLWSNMGLIWEELVTALPSLNSDATGVVGVDLSEDLLEIFKDKLRTVIPNGTITTLRVDGPGVLYDSDLLSGENIISFGADFVPPSVWFDMISNFRKLSKPGSVFVFDVIESGEGEDWISMKNRQGYQSFAVSRSYMREMLLGLGLREDDFELATSDRMTAPSGFTFRNILCKIKNPGGREELITY